jgi:hypothetical protein
MFFFWFWFSVGSESQVTARIATTRQVPRPSSKEDGLLATNTSLWPFATTHTMMLARRHGMVKFLLVVFDLPIDLLDGVLRPL